MPPIYKLEDLEIWNLAFGLYQKVSCLSQRMRHNHDYRFAEQIKSSSGSVMDNIAEGFERSSRIEFLHSLSIAKGECGELKSQLHSAYHDKYLNEEQFIALYENADKVSRKIAAFIKYLNQTIIRGFKFKDRR